MKIVHGNKQLYANFRTVKVSEHNLPIMMFEINGTGDPS